MDPSSTTILSRLAPDDFLGREKILRDLMRILGVDQIGTASGQDASLSHSRHSSSVALLGSAGTGKSELLRQIYDRLFHESGDVIPFHHVFGSADLDAGVLAREYASRFQAQFIAFTRRDPSLVSAWEQPFASLAKSANAEDYSLIRELHDSFERISKSGDQRQALRAAFSIPAAIAARTDRRFVILLDDVHLFNPDDDEFERRPEGRLEDARLEDARSELVRMLAPESSVRGRVSYLLTGRRRHLSELLPGERGLFGAVEFVNLAPLADEELEKAIRSAAEPRGIELRDSTIELMIQQLGRDLFYIHSVIDAAAVRGADLKSFIDFERVYTEDVLSGRIGRYLTTLLREIAPDPATRRAAVETLAMVIEAGGPVPVDALSERISPGPFVVGPLLRRLHARELLDVTHGFVTTSDDPVLADYIRATYRNEISGSRRPVAGEVLLGEKLRQSYRLMMSRYHRAMQAQLVQLVTSFDFQAVPASLFDQTTFDNQYRLMSRAQVRRALDEEQARVRLPQMVLVEDHGTGEQSGIDWRVFRATGFEGGIYSESNEINWWITLINSREPVDLDTLRSIDQRVESTIKSDRTRRRYIRWNVSKEGFSAACAEKLSVENIYFSNYSQLDLIAEFLTRQSATSGKPSTEFELVIPIEDEAELIAARTVEQIARAAEFSQDAVNQIKTALIEACINAAEHGDSPDRRIHQRFSVEDDRLTITVANKGKVFGAINGSSPAGARLGGVSRGRGLQIIRALMDDVYFERSDDGATLVMTKLLKRPETQ
jgi:serine/threonine-protein kinase RsbW